MEYLEEIYKLITLGPIHLHLKGGGIPDSIIYIPKSLINLGTSPFTFHRVHICLQQTGKICLPLKMGRRNMYKLPFIYLRFIILESLSCTVDTFCMNWNDFCLYHIALRWK